MINRLIAVVLCFGLIGCASMSQYEKNQYASLQVELQEKGLPEIAEKEPVLAGMLNILPGIGNIYLKQWGPFVGNLLLWPLSIVWGIPQAAIDANTINKQTTLEYYTYGEGKKELGRTESQN